MILINGECKNQIDVSDRGFQYGDGLFETIAVHNGKAVFLDRHLERLQAGCKRLCIECPPLGLLREEVLRVCGSSGKAVIKLIVTRGSGGRGYRLPDAPAPVRVVSLHPDPDYPRHYRDQGIAVRFCHTKMGMNPALAGLKHMNRLEQVLARSEWTDQAIQEGLMLDIEGRVVEGTMTNVFYCKNNVTYTPSIDFSGVNGIMRRIFIELLQSQGYPVEQVRPLPTELLQADEGFVCNSIIGIWPIRRIESTDLSIGPITRHCMLKIDEMMAESVP